MRCWLACEIHWEFRDQHGSFKPDLSPFGTGDEDVHREYKHIYVLHKGFEMCNEEVQEQSKWSCTLADPRRGQKWGQGQVADITIEQIESCGATLLLPRHKGLADCLPPSVSGMQHHFRLFGWEEKLSPWRCARTSVIWECQIQASSFETVFLSSFFESAEC